MFRGLVGATGHKTNLLPAQRLRSPVMESRAVPLYLPKGVDKVIGFGSSSFIGRIDDQTVLKNPRIPGKEWDRFELEKTIYDALGRHPRIITCFGLDARGLMLEYATNGSVKAFLARCDSMSNENRVKWCRQAGEALVYIHTKNVIHCDCSTRNFLLDNSLNAKLSDFQGIYVAPDGNVSYGYALENPKSFLPRPADHSNRTSDLFALGTAIYEIMAGHEPFPELDELDDEEEIEERYTRGQFPALDGVLGGEIIYKCWYLAYENASSCVKDLKTLEKCQGMES